jgi:hypothetical protein
MKKSKLLIAAAVVILSGCVAEVLREPVTLLAANPQMGKRYVTAQVVQIMLDSGYQRTINSGTEFEEIGTIQQGRVLRPLNSAFTIEGTHMHEAFPVVSNGRVVGFYLPVEKAYSPLSLTVMFPIK